MIQPKGVTKEGKKFKARIRINGSPKYLGIFETAELASKAYQDALREKQNNQNCAKQSN